MKFLINPVSKKMLAQLQRGRIIELSKSEKNFCSTDDFQDTLPKLYSLGLIDIKLVKINDEEILCVYITKAGIDFLNKHEEGTKKLGSKYNLN